MDFNIIGLIVAVLSLLATIIFGIPQLITWLKDRANTLYLVIVSNTNLYNDIVKDVEGLNITYHDKQIGNNAYLVKACICFVGSGEISSENTIKDIRIDLPKDVTVYNCKLVGFTENLDVNYAISRDSIAFKIPLMKNKEYFFIEAFLESKDRIIPEQYKLNSRIKNVNNSETINYQLKNNRINLAVSVFMGVAFILQVAVSFFSPREIDGSTIDQYEKKIYYKNKLASLSTFEEMSDRIHKYISEVRTDDSVPLDSLSLSLDSLNTIQKEHKDIGDIIKMYFKIDTVFQADLNKGYSWNKLSTYNFIEKKTAIYKISDNIYIEYKHLHYWKYVTFWMVLIVFYSGIIYVYYIFRSISKSDAATKIVVEYMRHRKK